MILKIGICDDDESIISTLTAYLERYQFVHNIDFEISSFTDSRQLLKCYNNTPGTFHILFLDVEMPEINGLELANTIREMPDRNVHIVFVSSYPEYMKDSFNVQAFQYLTKPLEEAIFQQEMQRIVKDITDFMPGKLLIPTATEDELIFLDELLYIKSINSKKRLLDFVLKDRRISSLGTIGEYEKKLSSSGFISPSQGYLVHMKYLHFIRKNQVILCNNEKIPLSRRKEALIRSYFNEQLLTLAKRR